MQRITSSWNENTVTWFTQPTTTTQNEATVPASVSANEDYPSIDVTALLQDMVDNPTSSFGFMLRLQDETNFRAMVFASSDYSVASKWPALTINYIPPTTACITLQPHDGCGKDALIWNAQPFNNATTNYGTMDVIGAHAWTNSGVPDTGRSLLEFDLTTIPSNVIITSASLSLYNNPTTSYAGGVHSWLSGPNNGLLQRVTSYWDEKTVTWMTQPTTTTLNQVSIPTSNSVNEDYLNIDVTQLVTDMYNNPLNSFGFLIRLETEEQYRSLVFGSSNYSNPTKNPKLDICYTIQTGVASIHDSPFIIYPNPALNKFYIESGKRINSKVTIELLNLMGEIISKSELSCAGLLKKEINVSELSRGVYFVKVSDGEKVLTQKLIIQ